nr:LuxR family transcriptional regulator [Ornithinimicrobium sp. F0845]
MLGRAEEQETIARLLASARLGRGGALALIGEAGVGKTALLAEAVSDIEGQVRVLRATGTEIEQDLPFAALHAVLRPALHLLDDLPGPQADALGGALSLRREGPGDRFATGAATLSLLSRLAEERPVVVVLDDVQWADQPSVEALTFAARRVHEDQVAILFGARSAEVPEALSSVPLLEVRGLDPASTAELLRQSHPGVVDADSLERVHRATGGNPLALLELGTEPALALLDPATGGEAGLLQLLPDRLHSAFARRLDLLTTGERAMALVVVVAGGDLRLTRAVHRRLDLEGPNLDGVDLDGADLDRLIATGLVTAEEGRLTFRHPLLRSVVYRTAPEDLRRAAHLAVAEELDGHEQQDLRVWHRAAAATQLDEHLAAELEEVGARAAARSALTVAATAFQRAARWSPDAGAARSRLVAAAEAAWDGGQREAALRLLAEAEPVGLAAQPERALPQCTVPERAVPERTMLAGVQLRARIAVRSGSIREGLSLLEEAAGLADPDQEVRLLAEACHACLYLADTAALRRVSDRLSDRLAAPTTDQQPDWPTDPYSERPTERRTGVESPATRGIGLAASGVARVLLGQDGTALLREAVPLLMEHVDPVTDHSGLPWLALPPLFLRDAQAGAGLREVIDRVRARVGVGALPNLLFHVARDQATSNAWDRAGANYDEAASLAAETGQSTELAASLAGLAALESRQGRSVACREHAAEALARCRERSIHFGEIWAELALADLVLSEGQGAEAVSRYRALTAHLDALGLRDPDLHPGPDLADALLRTGEPREADEVAHAFAELARVVGRPWSMARAERALGLIAPDEECDSHFQAALEHHDRTRDVFETARTHLAHGIRLRRSGQRVAARVALRAALGIFDGLGAHIWSDTSRAELTATGERVPPRELAGPGALTPQELQVCLLLAEGRTTREAAAALFLSPKTVEYHLRKAYTKLDIHSREELSAAMHGVA